MKNDINSLYSDISELLEDICSFLSDNTENGQFKTNSQDLAAKLINRCKSQLQEIAKVNTTDNDSNRYVDMHGSNGNSDYLIPYTKPVEVEEPQQIYADVSQDIQNSRVHVICPYASMPASKVSYNEKSGYLERKDKFLFLGIQKKFYGTLCNDWMLLYTSDKDEKPAETIYLKQFEAFEVEKKDFCFTLKPKFQELNNKNSNDIKPQFFTATTKKDMGQWVSFINSKSKNKNISESISTSNIDKLKFFEKRQSLRSLQPSIECGEIYEELEHENQRFGSNQKSPFKSKAIPPPRIPDDPRSAPNMPLPDTPEDIYDFIGGVEEEEEEYTALNIKDEDEPIYECDGEEIYHNAKEEEEEESIYDMIEAPVQNGDGEELYDIVHMDDTEEIVEQPPKPKKPEVPPLRSKLPPLKPKVAEVPPIKPKILAKPKGSFSFGKRH